MWISSGSVRVRISRPSELRLLAQLEALGYEVERLPPDDDA